jgi:hypothetical protein
VGGRAGLVGEIGGVNRGTTQTDFLALERLRVPPD